MKFTKITLLSVAAMMSLTSCFNDKTPTSTVEYEYKDNLNYVVNTEDGSSTLLAGTSVYLKYDLTARTVSIAMSDMQISPNGARMSFSAENVAFSYSNGFLVTKATEMIYGDHTLTDFVMRHGDCVVAASSMLVSYYDISFKIDGIYEVRLVPSAGIFDGKTTINPIAAADGTVAGQSTTINSAFYSYKLNLDKMTAQLSAYRLQFGGFTYSEITLKDVPFSVTPHGIVIASSEELIPYNISGTAYETVRVNNLNANFTYYPSMYLTMKINNEYDISAIDQISDSNNE